MKEDVTLCKKTGTLLSNRMIMLIKGGSKGNFLFPFKILNTFYNKGIVYKGRGDYVKSDKSNT